jgi:hypothetical protein
MAGIMDPVKKIRLEEERKLLVEELDTERRKLKEKSA